MGSLGVLSPDVYDVDRFPGDEEAIRRDEQIMDRDDCSIPLLIAQNGSMEPMECRDLEDKGDAARAAKNLEEAVEWYTRLLESDNTNVDYWAKRSSTLLELGQYKKAYQDCISVGEDVRNGQVWKTGGQCLLSMGMNAVAEKWLRKASELTGHVDKSILLAFHQARTKRFYGPLAKEWPIEVRFTDIGKAIYATRDIKRGETILRDMALISAPNVESVKEAPACSNCSRSLLSADVYFKDCKDRMTSRHKSLVGDHWPPIKIIDCPKCDYEQYCCEECQERAWSSYHRVICPGNNPASKELFEFCSKGRSIKEGFWNSVWSPMLMARLWATLIVRVESVAKSGSQPTQKHWDMANAPFRKFVATGDPEYVKSIGKMVALMNDIFTHPCQKTTIKIDNKEFNRRYYQISCNAQSFSSTLYGSTIYQNFCADVMKQSFEDFHKIEQFLREPPDATFGGLFPLQSCLNHSCDKNTETTDVQFNETSAGVLVLAKRDIAKGEEVTTAYTDLSMPRKKRRAILYRAYNFWCNCLRCRCEGIDGGHCTHCGVEQLPGAGCFPVCSKCKATWYCSAKCQKENWKLGHKKFCKKTPA